MAQRPRQVTVRFYRAVRASQSGPWPASGDVAGRVRDQLAAPRPDPYIDLGDGTYIIESHSNDVPILHISISAVRRDNLPLREHGGHTGPLPLPRGDNLAEQAHVVFFPRSVVGFLRSLAAPGHLRASNVLSTRCHLDVAFAPILRPEIESLVVNSLGVTQLELRVAGNSFDSASADSGDPVEAVHRLTSQFSGAAKVELRFTARDDADRQRFRSWIIRHLSGLTEGNDVEKAKATVLDRDGEKQVVDLLEDQIALTTEIHTRAESRSLDPDSVREAMTAAYNEQLSVITRSLEMHEDGQ